jgi:prepilin-type N-terminal cleavage/methylation domain-containing protein
MRMVGRFVARICNLPVSVEIVPSREGFLRRPAFLIAKRLECAQLAAAFVQADRPKRQQAGALQTLRAVRLRLAHAVPYRRFLSCRKPRILSCAADFKSAIRQIEDLRYAGSARNACAMTLPEMLVSVAVGSVALMLAVTVFTSSSISFTSIGNYIVMDQKSRSALDQMTRDIRRSQNLTSFASNQLVFVYSGTTNLTYTYNSSLGQLTSYKTGDTTTNVLLTGCNYLLFSMYNNVPQPGGTLTNAASVSQAKAISVNWRCSRNFLSRTNSEYIQESVIVIRNKPVS